MNEEAAKHIEELETVLETSKNINSLIEHWAFRAAYDEVSLNLSYLRRRREEENTEKADELIASLEKLYSDYGNFLTTKHYYELK